MAADVALTGPFAVGAGRLLRPAPASRSLLRWKFLRRRVLRWSVPASARFLEPLLVTACCVASVLVVRVLSICPRRRYSWFRTRRTVHGIQALLTTTARQGSRSGCRPWRGDAAAGTEGDRDGDAAHPIGDSNSEEACGSRSDERSDEASSSRHSVTRRAFPLKRARLLTNKHVTRLAPSAGARSGNEAQRRAMRWLYRDADMTCAQWGNGVAATLRVLVNPLPAMRS